MPQMPARIVVPDHRERLPPVATATKIVGSSPYDSGKIYGRRPYAWFWTCDNCGDSGMTHRVQQCPQCQHCCCENCPTYSHIEKKQSDAFPPVTYQYSVLQKDSVANLLPAQSKSKAQLPSSGSTSTVSENVGQVFPSPAADEGIDLLPPAATPDLVMTSDIESSSYSTPSLEAMFTRSSTQEPNTSSGPLSYKDYMDSETEFETDDAESVEGLTDNEDTTEASDHAINILYSRPFLILGHGPELASRLMPQIHAQSQFGFGTGTGGYTASPSQGSGGASETRGDFSVSSLTPGSGSSQDSSPQNKRGRERNESKDRGDKSGSKRPRKFRDRSAVPRRRYACHFHKKDPARYCPLTDPKFNTCYGRGNPLLRRMKEHYLKTHRPAQCERCYSIFKDPDELEDHQQAEPPCHNQPDELKEGIDDGQWAKIEPLFHVRRNLSTSQKEQDDFDKWFKIWDILFPNVPRPPNPWVVVPKDAESFLVSINRSIELDVENGVLQLDDHVRQRYERAIRLAFQNQLPVSAPVAPFNHSFLEISEPENDSAEHPSQRQTTVEVLENSLGRLISSQPVPQHLSRSYQDHIPPRLKNQSAPSPPRQFDVFEGTCISQPCYKSGAQVIDTPIISAVFESPINLRGTTTTQCHSAMLPSTECHSNAILLGEKPIEDQGASNIEQNQASEELWGELEPARSSYFDPWQDNFLPFNTNDFEFEEEQLDSDSLTKILESENGDPAALATWENSHLKN